MSRLPDHIRAHIARLNAGRLARRDDARATLFIREATIKPRERSTDDDDDDWDGSRFSVIASSDRPVRMWGWSEQLSHAQGAIDWSTCKSALLGHNRDAIIGGVVQLTPRQADGELDAELTVHEKAVTSAQVPVRDLVRDDALAGVSIGYAYDEDDCDYDEKTETLTVHRWRLLEISLTPTQADAAAHVKRSLPATIHPGRTPATRTKENAMGFRAWLKARGLDPADLSTDELTKLRDEYAAACRTDGSDPVYDLDDTPPAAPAPTPTEPTPARDSAAQLRTSMAAIASQAESLGLRASDYVGMQPEAARAAMLQAVAAERSADQQTPHTPTRVTADAADKLRDTCVDLLISEKRLERATSIFARQTGQPGAMDWEKGDLIDFFLRHFTMPTREHLRQVSGGRSQVTTGTFADITAVAALKLMQNGYTAVIKHWPLIARSIIRSDFKEVSVPGIQTAIFGTAPGEGNAFAALSQGASGGKGTNEFRGAVFDITKEALYNDELNLYLDELVGIGRTGARTEEAIVFQALEAASFAGATQALEFSEAHLATGWSAHAAQTGPAGDPLGIPARRLVTPIGVFPAAMKATTTIQGETTKRIFGEGELGIQPVPGFYLTDPDDWYLLCDPADAAMLWLIQHPDYPVPMLEPIDTGGVAAKKWRIEFPRRAFATSHATGRPVGAYKLTGPATAGS